MSVLEQEIATCREAGCHEPQLKKSARCRLHFNRHIASLRKVRNTSLLCLRCGQEPRHATYNMCYACVRAEIRARLQHQRDLARKWNEEARKKTPAPPEVILYRKQWQATLAAVKPKLREDLHARFTKVVARAMKKPLAGGPERTVLHDLGRDEALGYANYGEAGEE